MNDLEKRGPFYFSEVECKNAEELLQEIASDKSAGHSDNSPHLENLKFDSKYNGSSVAHPFFKKCDFDGTTFAGINGIASNILNCCFRRVEFRDSGMAFSDFSGTHFVENTTLINCSCTECSFLNAEFSDVFAEGSVFDRSYFIDTKFINTEFCHCSFEDTLFQNVNVKSCNLIHANLEYASFRNLRADESNFPFWGILRTFGGLETVRRCENSTIQYSDGAKKFTAEQFLACLMDLQPYFAQKHEYFILANINIFYGKQKDALYYIMIGLKHSLKQRDFRMVRYLCRLASTNHFFTSKELRQLYEALVTNSQISLMNDHQYQLYLREIAEIKRLLIDNPFFRPQMVITCSTEFDPEDYEGLGDFLRFFEQTIHRKLPQCSYYYSVRHNSPPVLEYFLSDILPNLYTLVNVIVFSLWGMSGGLAVFQKLTDIQAKRISNVHDKKSLEARVQRQTLENRLLEEQIHNQKLLNEKLEQELCALRKKEPVILTEDCPVPTALRGKVKEIHFTIQSSDPASIPLREYTFTAS